MSQSYRVVDGECYDWERGRKVPFYVPLQSLFEPRERERRREEKRRRGEEGKRRRGEEEKRRRGEEGKRRREEEEKRRRGEEGKRRRGEEEKRREDREEKKKRRGETNEETLRDVKFEETMVDDDVGIVEEAANKLNEEKSNGTERTIHSSWKRESFFYLHIQKIENIFHSLVQRFVQ